MQTDNR